MILEYVLRTHFPTQVGNVRFQVEDDGTVLAQQNTVEPPYGQEWTDAPEVVYRLERKPRERVRSLLEKNGFFDMQPLYEERAAMDGVVETLTFMDDNVQRSVTVDRAHIKQFRRLVKALASELRIQSIL